MFQNANVENIVAELKLNYLFSISHDFFFVNPYFRNIRLQYKPYTLLVAYMMVG